MVNKSLLTAISLLLVVETNSCQADEGMLSFLTSPFKAISNYFQERKIKSNVLKSFVKDIETDPFKRAAIDELIRSNDEMATLSSYGYLDYQTQNIILDCGFNDHGTFPKIVERAMAHEFARSLGTYFEGIGVGSLIPSRAVRKLNLQATSPFLEEQRRAYALYRYGLD